MGLRTKSALARRKLLGCNKLDTNTKLWWSLVAEFVSTLFVVLVSCFACIGWDAIHLALIALVFGAIVSTVVGLISHVRSHSAVSIGMLAKGKTSLMRYLLYALCKSAGAIVGTALFWALTPGALQESLSGTLVTDGVSKVQAFGEVFLTNLWLGFTVCAVCDPNRRGVKGSALLVIGLTVAISPLVAITSSGSRKNPDTSFSPTAIEHVCSRYWVYWLWPNFGGVTAAILYHFVFSAPKPVSSVELLRKQKSS